MDIYFASHNQNKQKEIQKIIGSNFKVLSLNDLNFKEEIVENEPSFQGNARLKIEAILSKFPNVICFSDDSGLVVPSLNNEPGIFSARYAGNQKNDEDNIQLLLKKLKNISDRNAYFITVIALFHKNKIHYFEGKIEGQIIDSKRGNNGFGYDPIFTPNGNTKTFAEMNLEEKNKYSHRAKAVLKMMDFLVK